MGNLACKSCGQNFQTSINCEFPRVVTDVPANRSIDLTQPVDVYADWIDACDAVAKDEAAPSTLAAPPSARQRQATASARIGLTPGERVTEEDRGFIDDEDEDAEAAYVDDD